MNLFMALALGYATWWPADHFLVQKFCFNTPLLTTDPETGSLKAMDIDEVGRMFGIVPRPGSERLPLPSADTSKSPEANGVRDATILWATGYGWLTLSTIACAALALSGGAAWGRAGGPALRRVGVILFGGGLLGLAWAAYESYSRYAAKFPPDHLRWGMIGLLTLLLFMGVMIGRGVRGLARCAAILLILSAAGSAVGLYLGAQCGALSPERSTFLTMCGVFVVHSLYGWLLLPISSRMAY